METVLGIDVSEFQGVLDWSKVQAAGVRFAILRAGYGRYAVDSCFSANARGAAEAGIPLGVYWFSYALDAAGARQEAQKCLETIKPHKIDLPVFFDFEYDTVSYAKKQGVTLGRQAFNDHAAAFCETVEAAGYRAGVYYNLDYYTRFVDQTRLGKYVQWFAQYNSEPQISDYAIWQYSSSGSIPGISGRFDMNRMKDTTLLEAAQAAVPGWKRDERGWWYRNADGSWPQARWKQIDGELYYFKEDGYMAENKMLRLDGTGQVVPAGDYYYKLGDVTSPLYRQSLDKAVAAGILAGKGGQGDDMILDMTEDGVRIMVFLDRAGVLG